MALPRKPNVWEAWASALVSHRPVIPFAEKGLTRAGLSCWGLFRLAWLEIRGVELPAYTDAYTSTLKTREVVQAVRSALDSYEPIPEGLERPGDGALLRLGGNPQHVALVLGRGLMLHIDNDGIGPRVEEYRTFLWKYRVLGFYRPRAAV